MKLLSKYCFLALASLMLMLSSGVTLNKTSCIDECATGISLLNEEESCCSEESEGKSSCHKNDADEIGKVCCEVDEIALGLDFEMEQTRVDQFECSPLYPVKLDIFSVSKLVLQSSNHSDFVLRPPPLIEATGREKILSKNSFLI